MREPTELFQPIVDSLLSAISADWEELVVVYHVDEEQSQIVASYVTSKSDGSGREEVVLSTRSDLDYHFRLLRTDLLDKAKFSRCRLHLKRNGYFNADYAYDKPDWDALVLQGWNFADVVNKRDPGW